MRLRILALILFPFFAGAQPGSLHLTTTTVNLSGPANTTLSGHAHVENTGTGLLDLTVMRVQNDTAPGHNSFFCWGGACFPATTSQAPFSLPSNPGDIDTTLEAKVEGRSFPGNSVVSYCFYDASNPSDSVCVTYTYNFTAVGIDELAQTVSLSNATPNPADRLTSIGYAVGKGTARIVISDLLGGIVKDIPMKDKQGALVLSTSDLSSGIYIYTLLSDNRPVASRRLVVSHK